MQKSSSELPRRKWWQLASTRIAIGFLIWSTLWIVASDALLHFLIKGTPPVIWKLETLKGLFYVGVTGMLLYWFARARELEYLAARLTMEYRLRRLSESNLISICYWKSTGEITGANDAFLNLLGYTRKELKQRKLNWRDFTPSEYRVRDDDSMKRLTDDGRHVTYEKEFIRKDATRVPVIVGAALLDQSGNRGIAYALNVSELRSAQLRSAELEEQLRQSQKLEAMGQLASGVAHDFNNLLNIIVGYTCLMETSQDLPETARQQTGQILKASERASALVRKLLAFGRKQVLNPELLDVNSVLLEFKEILPRLIGETVDIHLHLTPNVWLVEVDHTQFEQVIVNLVVNARDAMPDGGVVTISTANLTNPDRVLISFNDTGTGMDEETKARIFDPFFTTKPAGQGTGLGLSTVYGIVGQSGGQIMVETELGKGTTFLVHLPRTQRVRIPPIVPEPKASRAGAAKRGSETILVAEDEPDLLRLLTQILEKSGYKVLPAKDGAEAIAVSRGYVGPIALLITDVIMPHTGGQELARTIRSARPEMKVIYMTGYAEDATLLANPTGVEVLLEKPVSPDQLNAKIRELLDSPTPQS